MSHASLLSFRRSKHGYISLLSLARQINVHIFVTCLLISLVPPSLSPSLHNYAPNPSFSNN